MVGMYLFNVAIYYKIKNTIVELLYIWEGRTPSDEYATGFERYSYATDLNINFFEKPWNHSY